MQVDATGNGFDASAVSMSGDGNRVAVGDYSWNGNEGRMLAFGWKESEQQWVGMGSVGNGLVEDGNGAGSEVSLSSDGSRVAYGASRPNDGGEVKVLEWSGAAWVNLGPSMYAETSSPVVRISGDGNRIAVGTPTSQSFAGKVKVYEYGGASWSQVGSEIVGAEDFCGIGVDLNYNGSVLAVGCTGHNSYAGKVRIFEWNQVEWTESLPIEGSAQNDYSGRYVSLSSDGDRVLISSPTNTYTDTSGKASVFQSSGGSWVQVGDVIPVSNGGVDLSGDGKRVAVANKFHNSNAGKVSVYTLSDSNTWQLFAGSVEGEEGQVLHGTSVSLSYSGLRLGVAPGTGAAEVWTVE